MYCSNCGEAAAGNFCSACGARVSAPTQVPVALPVARAVALPDWRHEVRVEALLRHPAVRERVARSAALAVKGVSGEKWLELFDKIARPPVSFKTVVEVAGPLYARLGIATGKSRAGALAAPAGEVLAAVLCSLARHGQTVAGSHQCGDGCVIDAALPSDFFAMAGKLVVTVRRAGAGTSLEAATAIPGQLYDWGKSRRCLDQLFAEVGADCRAS